MSELDRIWNSNTPALLAAEIIADAQKKAAAKDAASKRAGRTSAGKVAQ